MKVLWKTSLKRCLNHKEGRLIKLQNILPKIAIKGTEDRRHAILSFLKEHNVKYYLQEIEEKYPVYSSSATKDLDGEFEDIYDDLDDDYFGFFNCQYDKVTEYKSKYYYNIIVDIGDFENAKQKILLTAHYDVVYGSSGANDNGSSISILLKLITEYNGTPIRIVFFDGEECGGIGSRNYIEKYITTDELKNEYIMLNLDVCGCGDKIVIENQIKNIKYDDVSNFCKLNDIIEINRLPFNDAKIFDRKDISNICIVALPQEDIDISNGKEIIDPITGRKQYFGSYIWKYQHNGIYDDIAYINYNIMEQIYDCIKNKLLFSIFL